MQKRTFVVWILVIVAMTLLAGCGGGGGGGSDNPGDTTAPTVSSTSPANGSAGVAMNSSIAATFSEGMDSSTINGTTFTISGGSGSVSGTVTCNGSTATFTPSSNLSYSTTYTATITTGAKDAAGNAVASNYTWNFTTGNASDTTPPTVSSTNPANNATEVAVNSAITATFSETMDTSSITTATFYVGGVSGTVIYSGTTATFTPSSNLNYNTTYTVTITTGAKDAAGNAMASNYSWSFTTGTAPDTTPPTVSSTSPAGNATGIAINTAITATFSETMDSSTVTTATFTLKQGATPIAGTVAYSGTTATFTPSFNLSYSTTYTATITTGAKDAAGNAMASNDSWSFTTGNAADTTAPTNTTASNFISSGASSTSATSVTLAVSATDAVGVTAYFTSESSTAPSASASGWTAVTSATSYSASVSFTLSSGGGTKTVYVWFKDSTGNVSSFASDTIALNTTFLQGGAIQGNSLNLTNTVTTFAGSAGLAGSTDGTGTAARFWDPVGITTDGTNLFVVNANKQTIRKIVISTGVVTTFAGSAGITGSADGIGTAARFFSPWGITTDGTNLFVADRQNHTIRKIVISTSVVTTIAGSAGVMGAIDGTGSAARFNNPLGITTDGTNLFVADYGNHTIRKVVISTGVVTTFAGSAGVIGAIDGTGSAARFNNALGITTDGTNLFVADYANHTIRKIVISTGVVTTIAGSAGWSGSSDGTGTAARFWYPDAITTDGTNLFVAEYANAIIRKIDMSAWVVTTIAGSAGITGSTDGIGSAAKFNYPAGITTDGISLFVTDVGNSTIRKIE